MRYRGGRIAQKLKTQRERERYRARKHIGELPFGWSKSVLRFRRFSLRDLDNVTYEWDVITLTVNLRRLSGKI